MDGDCYSHIQSDVWSQLDYFLLDYTFPKPIRVEWKHLRRIIEWLYNQSCDWFGTCWSVPVRRMPDRSFVRKMPWYEVDFRRRLVHNGHKLARCGHLRQFKWLAEHHNFHPTLLDVLSGHTRFLLLVLRGCSEHWYCQLDRWDGALGLRPLDVHIFKSCLGWPWTGCDFLSFLWILFHRRPSFLLLDERDQRTDERGVAKLVCSKAGQGILSRD